MKLPIRLLNWIIAAYISIIILVSTSILNASVRFNKIKVLGIRSDYMLHALMFIPWMILTRWRWDRGKHGAVSFWLGMGSGLLLIAISEGIQFFVPFRSLSFSDLTANTLGLAMGAWLAWKESRCQESGN